MAPIQHFAPPAGLKAPPLSFATRVGDLLFVSGIRCRRDECVVCRSLWAAAVSRPHHMRGPGASGSCDADRNRVHRISWGTLISPQGGARYEMRANLTCLISASRAAESS